jgi:hypothetical protein
MGQTLKHAGVAVTITSCTDVFAFAIGSITVGFFYGFYSWRQNSWPAYPCPLAQAFYYKPASNFDTDCICVAFIFKYYALPTVLRARTFFKSLILYQLFTQKKIYSVCF